MWTDPADLPSLAERHDFLLLVGPSAAILPNLATLKPRVFQRQEDKKSFSIDEMREILAQNIARHLTRQYFVIQEADTMTSNAMNAALKLLEEPHSNAAFIWLVENPERLLPTVKSRATTFHVRLPASLLPDTTEAKTLLFGQPIEQLKLIKKNEKDHPGTQKLLTTCAALLDQQHDISRAQALLRASQALSRHVYPRLALLNLV